MAREPMTFLSSAWSIATSYWLPVVLVLLSVFVHLSTEPDASDVVLSLIPEALRTEYTVTALLSVGLSILAARIFSDLTERRLLDRVSDVTMETHSQLVKQTTAAVVGANYPRGYFEEVVSSCFGNGLLRESIAATYTFDRVEGHAEVLRVQAHIDLTIRNVGDNPKPYRHRSFIPNAFAHLGLIAAPTELFIDSQDRLTEDVVRVVRDQATKPRIVFEAEEISIGGGDTVSVAVCVELYKGLSDSEAFRTSMAAQNVTVSVFGADKCGITPEVSSIHRAEFKPSRRAKGADVREWRLREYFLPNNGWLLYWSPTRAEPPS